MARKPLRRFQKAIELNPYFWVNQDSLGNAYFQLGDYPKALQAFHPSNRARAGYRCGI